MQSLEDLAQLFSDLGENTPEVVEIVQHGSEASWAISLDDDLVVIADLSENAELMTFSADLGQPDAQNRAGLCESLLAYNALRLTTGVTMATSEPGGPFEMHCDVTAASLDLPTLKAIVLNFAAKAALWRQIVATGGSSGNEMGDPALLTQAAIRV